jgi:hypothetical protein
MSLLENLQKKYISIQEQVKLRKASILMETKVSSYLSFFLSSSIAATYIFTAPTCTTAIVTLKPRAELLHFIL